MKSGTQRFSDCVTTFGWKGHGRDIIEIWNKQTTTSVKEKEAVRSLIIGIRTPLSPVQGAIMGNTIGCQTLIWPYIINVIVSPVIGFACICKGRGKDCTAFLGPLLGRGITIWGLWITSNEPVPLSLLGVCVYTMDFTAWLWIVVNGMKANIHDDAECVYVWPPVTCRGVQRRCAEPFKGCRPPVYSQVTHCPDGDRAGLSVRQLQPMQLLIK